MTGDNRRENIRTELARADEALRAAEALADLGLAADAVSRAWYASYHMLRALLFARGLEPRSQSGAIHLFNRELVRPGIFDSSYNRLLSGMQSARELADYDAAVVFSPDDARRDIADAKTFGAAVTRFLQAEGWLQEP